MTLFCPEEIVNGISDFVLASLMCNLSSFSDGLSFCSSIKSVVLFPVVVKLPLLVAERSSTTCHPPAVLLTPYWYLLPSLLATIT